MINNRNDKCTKLVRDMNLCISGAERASEASVLEVCKTIEFYTMKWMFRDTKLVCKTQVSAKEISSSTGSI